MTLLDHLRCCSAVLFATVLAGCPGRVQHYAVSPDQKHVVIGSRDNADSIDVDTMRQVAHVSGVWPGTTEFSRDGSRFWVRSMNQSTLVVSTAGGDVTDIGDSIAPPTFSPDGNRILFLRNPRQCPVASRFQCAAVFVAPSAGGEAVQVGSGVQVIIDDAIEGDGERYWKASVMGHSDFAGNDTVLFTRFDGSLLTAPADGHSPATVLSPGLPAAAGGQPIPPAFWPLREGLVLLQDGTGLMLVDARGGTPSRVADGAEARLFCSASIRAPRDLTCGASAAGSLALIVPRPVGDTIQMISLAGEPSSSVTGKPLAFDPTGRLTYIDAVGDFAQLSPAGDIHALAVLAPPLTDPSAVSPDGEFIAFVRSAHAPSCPRCNELVIVTTGDGTTRTLSSGAVPFNASIVFSPDSRAVLLSTVDRKLAAVAVRGGIPTFFADHLSLADWVGPRHVVISREFDSPLGVQILTAP